MTTQRKGTDVGKTYHIAPRVEFTPLATGEYILRLMHWEEVTEERDTQFSKKGDIRIQFQWEVEVPGDDPVERRDWAPIPRTWSKKSKFVQIALALLHVPDQFAAENGFEVDWDDGLGQRCKASIVRKPKEGSNEWTDSIVGYFPLDQVATAPSRRPAQPAPSAPDDDDIAF